MRLGYEEKYVFLHPAGVISEGFCSYNEPQKQNLWDQVGAPV